MSVFEVLASNDDSARIAGTRAVIAAQERAKEQFEKFVSKARNDDDREQRLAMIDDQLRKVVAEIAEEYGVEESENLYLAATAVLGGGHPAGCDCGFCKNKGKGFGNKSEDETDEKQDDEDDDGDEEESKKPWEKDASAGCDCGCEGCEGGNHCSSEKCIETKHTDNPPNKSEGAHEARTASFDWERVAADVETGDTFAQERVTADAGPGASPTIDKSRVPDGGLKPIDVPSKQHPLEQQSITQTPDYGKDLPGPSETGTSQSPEEKSGVDHADHTDTWSGTEGQASPVTSRVAKWSVVE